MTQCHNYRDCLFSLNGAAPTHLPASIRLENGQTRSTKFISIEDLNSVGYSGPISVPEYDENTQYLVWESGTLTFSVHERTTPYSIFQLDDTEDYKVRVNLKEEAESILKSLFDSSLTDVGTLAYVERYKYVTHLLASTEDLHFSDVEVFEYNSAYSASEVSLVQEQFERDNPVASGCYHHFGFVPFLDTDGLVPNTFKLNPAWTQNLDPNVLFTVIPDEGGSPGLVQLSGYNMVTGDNTYEIVPGETKPLIFGAVFYPND